jgi:hypothetical protein
MMGDQVQQRVFEQVAQVTGSKYLNTVQDQNCSFLFWSTNKQRINENESKINNRTMNKINEWLTLILTSEPIYGSHNFKP